jgi:hypothetical protein
MARIMSERMCVQVDGDFAAQVAAGIRGDAAHAEGTPTAPGVRVTGGNIHRAYDHPILALVRGAGSLRAQPGACALASMGGLQQGYGA